MFGLLPPLCGAPPALPWGRKLVAAPVSAPAVPPVSAPVPAPIPALTRFLVTGLAILPAEPVAPPAAPRPAPVSAPFTPPPLSPPCAAPSPALSSDLPTVPVTALPATPPAPGMAPSAPPVSAPFQPPPPSAPLAAPAPAPIASSEAPPVNGAATIGAALSATLPIFFQVLPLIPRKPIACSVHRGHRPRLRRDRRRRHDPARRVRGIAVRRLPSPARRDDLGRGITGIVLIGRTVRKRAVGPLQDDVHRAVVDLRARGLLQQAHVVVHRVVDLPRRGARQLRLAGVRLRDRHDRTHELRREHHLDDRQVIGDCRDPFRCRRFARRLHRRGERLVGRARGERHSIFMGIHLAGKIPHRPLDRLHAGFEIEDLIPEQPDGLLRVPVGDVVNVRVLAGGRHQSGVPASGVVVMLVSLPFPLQTMHVS